MHLSIFFIFFVLIPWFVLKNRNSNNGDNSGVRVSTNNLRILHEISKNFSQTKVLSNEETQFLLKYISGEFPQAQDSIKIEECIKNAIAREELLLEMSRL